MAQLAIKGHSSHGKDVIEILEMLGGKNKAYLNGTDTNLVYYICSENYIDTLYAVSNAYRVFTLEEFLEKFPYKVGGKVKNAKINDFIGRITNVQWDDSEEQIIYVVEWNDVTKSRLTYFAKGLQSYKEETMEKNTDTAIAPDLRGEDYSGRRFGYKIPDGYEFECVRENEIILKQIKPQYPKTFEECCNIKKADPNFYIDTHLYSVQLETLYKLLICRDAYWKIAGEEMGLGKPWKPDWKKQDKKYIISVFEDTVIYFENETSNHNTILAFPTEEMRDAFKENFDSDIDECKEFL